MIITMDITNWKTTNAFLKIPEPPILAASLPFNTTTGLKAERKRAGYTPEPNPITTTMRAKAPKTSGSNSIAEDKGLLMKPENGPISK